MFKKPWSRLVDMGKESMCTSHMYGRNSQGYISSTLMMTYGKILGDKSLRILTSEAEVVMNLRPLTVKAISDANGLMTIFQALA